MTDWRTEIRNTHITVYLRQLGLEVRSNRWGPCPACHEKTERNGQRYPLGILGGKKACICNACGTRMDAFDLVAFYLFGKPGKELGRDFLKVKRWFGAPEQIEARKAQPKEEGRKLPPADELRFLLRNSTPISQSRDRRVIDYLKQIRGYSLTHTPAAALPSSSWQGWERIGKWWPRRWADEFPVVVTAWTPDGKLASIHGRAVAKDAQRKTTWPYQCDSRGLLFTDPKMARPMLKGKTKPERVYLCEGITDFLWACQEQARADTDYGVIGFTSGFESGLTTVPWPDRTKIIALTDPDRAGGKYLDKIAEALAPRLVYRSPIALVRSEG